MSTGFIATRVELPNNKAIITLYGNRCQLTPKGMVNPVFEGLIDDLPQWAIDYLMAEGHIEWRDDK